MRIAVGVGLGPVSGLEMSEKECLASALRKLTDGDARAQELVERSARTPREDSELCGLLTSALRRCSTAVDASLRASSSKPARRIGLRDPSLRARHPYEARRWADEALLLLQRSLTSMDASIPLTSPELTVVGRLYKDLVAAVFLVHPRAAPLGVDIPQARLRPPVDALDCVEAVRRIQTTRPTPPKAQRALPTPTRKPSELAPLQRRPLEARLLSPNNVASRLSYAPSTVYGLIQSGALPSVRISHAPRVLEEDLGTFAAKRGAVLSPPEPRPAAPLPASLSLQAAAELLNITRSTLRTFIDRELAPGKPCPSTLETAALEDYLRGRRQGG